MVWVKCDVFEEKSGIPKLLEEMGAEVTIGPLITDYVVGEATGIERKSYSDLWGSMTQGSDHHVVNQIAKARSELNMFLLIEGSLVKFLKMNKNGKKALAMQASIQNVLAVPVLEAMDKKESAKLIFAKAKYCQEHTGTLAIPRSMNAETKKEPKKDELYFYQGLKNVGLKTAKILIETFDNPEAFLNWLSLARITYTKTGNPKGYENAVNMKGIGWKFIRDNQTLIFGGEITDQQA